MTLISKASRVLPGLLLGMSCAAIAAEPPATQATPAESSTTAQDSTAQSGSKVGFDRKSGEFRPLTTDESQQLDRRAPSTARSGKQLTPAGNSFARPANATAAAASIRHGADGTVSVKLPEDQMSTMMVTRDASGQLRISEQNADHIGDSATPRTGVASE